MLIFKALCALGEYADASHDAPLEPTFGLRFALAFLYANSNGDSSSFTSFWDEVQDHKAGSYSPNHGQYSRATYSRTFLQGIINAVPKWKCPGVPHELIAKARSTGNAHKVFSEAREAEAKLIAQWEEEHRKRREAQRKSKDCGYL